MKLICKCGNILDFGNNKNGSTVEGFNFITDDNDNLIIHCTKCDKIIVLSDPEEVEND